MKLKLAQATHNARHMQMYALLCSYTCTRTRRHESNAGRTQIRLLSSSTVHSPAHCAATRRNIIIISIVLYVFICIAIIVHERDLSVMLLAPWLQLQAPMDIPALQHRQQHQLRPASLAGLQILPKPRLVQCTGTTTAMTACLSDSTATWSW